MYILAIDVSISGCSIAILDTYHQDSFIKRVETDRGQAEMLIPMIDDLTRDANIKMSDINMIAVTRGPGSFTGVRIGLATARSLGLALNLPVIGLSTLDVIARSERNDHMLCLIDTKRGDYYGQVGEGGEPRIWSEAEIGDFQGSLAKDKMPDILTIAHMALEIYQGQKGYDITHGPTPIYLREAEVSQSKKKSIYQIGSE